MKKYWVSKLYIFQIDYKESNELPISLYTEITKEEYVFINSFNTPFTDIIELSKTKGIVKNVKYVDFSTKKYIDDILKDNNINITTLKELKDNELQLRSLIEIWKGKAWSNWAKQFKKDVVFNNGLGLELLDFNINNPHTPDENQKEFAEAIYGIVNPYFANSVEYGNQFKLPWNTRVKMDLKFVIDNFDEYWNDIVFVQDNFLLPLSNLSPTTTTWDNGSRIISIDRTRDIFNGGQPKGDFWWILRNPVLHKTRKTTKELYDSLPYFAKDDNKHKANNELTLKILNFKIEGIKKHNQTYQKINENKVGWYIQDLDQSTKFNYLGKNLDDYVIDKTKVFYLKKTQIQDPNDALKMIDAWWIKADNGNWEYVNDLIAEVCEVSTKKEN